MRARDPRTVEFYDGLVFKTASMWAGYMQEDFEDLQQICWEKVVKALRAYNPERSKLPVERYVFMCLMNLRKDMLKRRRRDDSYIEDEHATFERRYLSEANTFDRVESERPLIPSTLSYLERHVLALLYEGYTEREVQRRLGCTRRECEAALNGLQAKFGDWKPSPVEQKMSAAA